MYMSVTIIFSMETILYKKAYIYLSFYKKKKILILLKNAKMFKNLRKHTLIQLPLLNFRVARKYRPSQVQTIKNSEPET